MRRVVPSACLRVAGRERLRQAGKHRRRLRIGTGQQDARPRRSSAAPRPARQRRSRAGQGRLRRACSPLARGMAGRPGPPGSGPLRPPPAGAGRTWLAAQVILPSAERSGGRQRASTSRRSGSPSACRAVSGGRPARAGAGRVSGYELPRRSPSRPRRPDRPASRRDRLMRTGTPPPASWPPDHPVLAQEEARVGYVACLGEAPRTVGAAAAAAQRGRHHVEYPDADDRAVAVADSARSPTCRGVARRAEPGGVGAELPGRGLHPRRADVNVQDPRQSPNTQPRSRTSISAVSVQPPGVTSAMPRVDHAAVQSAQVERHPCDRRHLVRPALEGLDRAHPTRRAGTSSSSSPVADGARGQGPGHHRPAAGDAEHPVDPQPYRAIAHAGGRQARGPAAPAHCAVRPGRRR